MPETVVIPKLTKAQARAAVWLPAKGRWRVQTRGVGAALQSLRRVWPQLCEEDDDFGRRERYWRLTGHGMDVIAEATKLAKSRTGGRVYGDAKGPWSDLVKEDDARLTELVLMGK